MQKESYKPVALVVQPSPRTAPPRRWFWSRFAFTV